MAAFPAWFEWIDKTASVADRHFTLAVARRIHLTGNHNRGGRDGGGFGAQDRRAQRGGNPVGVLK